MTTVAASPRAEPPAEAPLSQRQLIWRRFRKHRLAVIAMSVVGFLYLIAVLAGFLAPQSIERKDLDYANCPPQPVCFSFRHGGFYAPVLRQHVDEVTLRQTYVRQPGEADKLGFFVQGDEYRLLGLVRCRTHFFGADPARNGWTSADQRRPFLLLGGDKYGRDIFSRLLHGARVSLSVGLVGIVVTFVLGLAIGGVSGYMSGRIDTVIQRLIEIINSFPRLPMWLALGAAVPNDWSPLKTYFAITVALGLLSWTGLARVVRGKILSLREEDYTTAARLLGASHGRIIFRHLLPGFTSHIIVSLTLAVPGVILGETSLSFLGLGLREPIVSWGVMLQDCMDIEAVRYYPWLMAPVVMIVMTVLSFNFLGDGLRDAADPYAAR
jgi:peptide/nickel transport system permease protein